MLSVSTRGATIQSNFSLVEASLDGFPRNHHDRATQFICAIYLYAPFLYAPFMNRENNTY
jgi:hypothetical protein